jgi:hypothetical protein
MRYIPAALPALLAFSLPAAILYPHEGMTRVNAAGVGPVSAATHSGDQDMRRYFELGWADG